MKTKTNKQTKNDNKYGEKERNNQTETFKKGTKEQRKIEEREEGREKKHRKVADQENGCHVNDSVVDFNKKKRKRGKGNKMKKERN